MGQEMKERKKEDEVNCTTELHTATADAVVNVAVAQLLSPIIIT